MNKQSLFADTVLRRSAEGQLYLMNRQEGGFREMRFPIESEQWLVDHYHVQVGEWTRDEHGECCPVTQISSRGEQTTMEEDEMSRAQALGQALYEDGVLEDQCLQREGLSSGLKQFIDSHPGVRVALGQGSLYVALMPDGTVFAVDKDGAVIAEEDLPETD